MRTIIDIPDDQLPILADQCRIESVSRAEIVRRAISFYLEKRRPKAVDVFGLWKDAGREGVEYQRSLRAEWDE